MNQRRIFMFILGLVTATGSLFFASPVLAKVDIGDTFGFGDIKDLGSGTNYLVAPTFSVAAAAVVVYFIWGAFKYLTSGGEKEQLQEAQKMITHAIIGFVLLMATFLIIQFLLASLFGIKDLQLIGG